ncbi:MAG: class I SAM-dependent methyltransferase [candidate division WOR-3 bacterium]|nr:class I SAM-dependent methyltransferase [candidate division WOR-3 bacterium]
MDGREVTGQASPGRWGDRDFIRVWDARPPTPLRDEQLDILATVVKDGYRKGARILDLGCGTGNVEKLILDRLPVARFTCVDRSPVMLEFARDKLKDHDGQCNLVQSELGRLSPLRLPGRPFQFVISVNVIHELTHAAKHRLFRSCRDAIARAGMLLIIDRLAIDNRRLRGPYQSVLQRLQRVHGVDTGEYSAHFADPGHKDDEHAATLDQYFRWLLQAGFHPTLLHLHFHKALIAAVPEKPAH